METKIRKRGKQPRNEEFVKKKKVKREKEKELQQESYQSAIGSLVDDDGVEVDTVIEGATESGEKTSCEVIVFLDNASLEVAKTNRGSGSTLLNGDEHKSLIKKSGRDPADIRPDIAHQCLLALLDSPLNKAGKLKVYIRTNKNVLIEVHPQIRIPRTFKRFSGLMGTTFPHRSPSPLYFFRAVLCIEDIPQADMFVTADDDPPYIIPYTAELLTKFKIRATNSQETLLKVIRNPVTSHFPVGCRKFGFSYSSEKLENVVKHAAEVCADKPKAVVYVIGAMARGKVDADWVEDTLAISSYPLSGACVCNRVTHAYELSLNIL